MYPRVMVYDVYATTASRTHVLTCLASGEEERAARRATSTPLTLGATSEAFARFSSLTFSPCLSCHSFRHAKSFPHNSTSADATGKQSAGIVQRSITWAGIISDDLHVLGLNVAMPSALANGEYQRNALHSEGTFTSHSSSTLQIGVRSWILTSSMRW